MASRQFDRLLRLFTLLVPAVAGGCTERSAFDGIEFKSTVCDVNGLDVLSQIQPVEAVDYVEWRSTFVGIDFEGEAEPNVLDAAGELCGSATDVDACVAAFAALDPTSGIVTYWPDGDSHQSLAFTRGDAAEAVRTLPDLNAFIGPIDSAGDAALLAISQDRNLVCDGRDNVAEVDDGYQLLTRRGFTCGGDVSEVVIEVSASGDVVDVAKKVVERGDPNCNIGRVPAGLCRGERGAAANAVGGYFADVAELEAASVAAFEQVAAELAAHGAPRGLRRRALQSRRDEVRHAAVTARIARRYGGRPKTPRVQPFSPRCLTEVAADNAAEGCIRETFGALVAHVQARRAADPVVRRALRRIAVEETRHAALSWDMAQWARARMSVEQRRRVAVRTKRALAKMEGELAQEFAPAVHRVAGLPDPDEARALFGQLRHALFQEQSEAA